MQSDCDDTREGVMAAPDAKKRGLEHLDDYEPKPAKHLRSLHDRMAERRLVVILERASLETVKVRRQARDGVLLWCGPYLCEREMRPKLLSGLSELVD